MFALTSREEPASSSLLLSSSSEVSSSSESTLESIPFLFLPIFKSLEVDERVTDDEVFEGDDGDDGEVAVVASKGKDELRLSY